VPRLQERIGGHDEEAMTPSRFIKLDNSAIVLASAHGDKRLISSKLPRDPIDHPALAQLFQVHLFIYSIGTPEES